jgi:signal transduction histidine kinase
MKTKTEGHGEGQKMCGVLGLSVSEKSSLGEDEASEFYVSATERVLQRLLRKYPRGQVFDLREGGSLIPSKRSILQIADVAKTGSKPEKILRNRRPRGSSKQRDAQAILQMLPGARSVVFSPLWDSHRGRWFAGSFAWTTRSTRVLTRPVDLNYLVAFGNSIMADVARLDAIAADQAKSDFISSISHELRTPLRGILAWVEFLQDMTVLAIASQAGTDRSSHESPLPRLSKT